MQDDSITDAAATTARLNALRQTMQAIKERQEAHLRQLWRDMYERDMRVGALDGRQDSRERAEAYAYQEEQLGRLMANGRAWQQRLVSQARKRFADLIRRDGYACHYCGTTRQNLEIDHVLPRSRGGSNVTSNLVLACPPCNRSKNDRTPEEWQRSRATGRKKRRK